MIREIFVIVFLVFLNALFAMGELALISARKSRLMKLQEERGINVESAISLSGHPHIFLPTIQFGMTLVSILEGAYGGMEIQKHLTAFLIRIHFLKPIAPQLSMGLVLLVITTLMLVFGELVPKQLALRNPELIAARLAFFLEILARIMRPVVWLLYQISNVVLWVMGGDSVINRDMTEEELKAYIAEGSHLGVIKSEERTMIERLLRLADKSVRAVMTPRNELYWIDRYANRGTLTRVLRQSIYERVVVCAEKVDNPVGVILVKDMLDRVLDGMPVSIEEELRSALIVPDSLSALDMLLRIRSSQSGIAFVIDEYGAFEGVVTVSDLFDAIVGETVCETQCQAKKASKLLPNTVLSLNGTESVDDLKDRLGLRVLPDEGCYHTLGGLLLTLLRRVPSVGDKVVYEGWLLEVKEMDGRRVSCVLASRQTFAEY
ncbi:MAG: HlyC/CorC family transporter [Acetobacter sp.]|nr:HlyC/CorC family transporter [Acetobacter sp.]